MPWRLDSGGESFELTPPSRLTVDNGEALIDAALAGAGLIYIHEYMVRAQLDAGSLTTVFETNVRDADPVFAIYPQTRSLSPKVRVVVDHLASALAVRPTTDAQPRAG